MNLQLFAEQAFDTAGESAALGVLVPTEAAQDVPADAVQGAAEGTAAQNLFLPHIESMHRQGEALRAVFPKFDLRRELSNPTFRKLTSPAVGMSVEDAYYAVHRRELERFAMHRAAQDAAARTASAVRAGQLRPVENGSVPQAASVTAFDYRSATREQREALKKRIFDAGVRGEKIYP